jgi:hypothetical protein
MAKFKCKQSGNVFEFVLPHDIASMRKHPEYGEVIEEQPKEITIPEFTKKPAVKKTVKGE